MFHYHRYPKQNRGIKDADLMLIRRAFDLADSDVNGYLDREDFKVAYTAVFGCKPSKRDLNETLEKCGQVISQPSSLSHLSSSTEETLVIDFNAFQKITLERLKYSDGDDEIIEAFKLLDARCKGFVDFNDFQHLVHRFMPNFDVLKMKRIFNEGDRDDDGRVSFRDFQLLMKNNLFKS